MNGKTKGEPFGSPTCQSSHAGTLPEGCVIQTAYQVWGGAAELLESMTCDPLERRMAGNLRHNAWHAIDKKCRRIRGGVAMRFSTIGAVLLTAAVLTAACGGSHEAPAHEKEATAPAPAPPTPDTTPVVALRTPAGLVLKPGEAPAAPTPAPK